MIVGIGIDIIEIQRIAVNVETYKKRFLDRCFTAYEQEQAQFRMNQAAFFAKRWAAKEAMVKALGTGFASRMKLTDIEVYAFDKGQPHIRLSGETQKVLRYVCNNPHIHLTLSDNMTMATAMVVLEDRQGQAL